MKYGYKEVRRIYADDLRNLCIARGWYTKGCTGDYEVLLHNMAQANPNISTDDIVEIAQDILEHSEETDQEFTSVCFDIAKIAVTFFEEVQKQ